MLMAYGRRVNAKLGRSRKPLLMTTTIEESKRLKAFRLTLAKLIPKIPNDKITLKILESKSLNSILIDYINWQLRLIHPRPRAVVIEPAVTADKRWSTVGIQIKELLDKVRAGSDLNPHLSLRAFKNGFAPAAAIPSPQTDIWADKDFQLNATGYHHFHLSSEMEASGFAKRSDEVLFAQVTRESFVAIGIFDHSVFDAVIDAVTSIISAERSRLANLHEKRISAGHPPGTVIISSLIATSGHTLHNVRLADRYGDIARNIDPKLDELSSRGNVFEGVPHEEVKKMKLAWHLNYLDLGLVDKTTDKFYILQYGPL